MVTMPCKDCPDRHEACHDKCGKYQDAKKESFKEYSYNKKKNMSAISSRMLNEMVKQGKWGKDRLV